MKPRGRTRLGGPILLFLAGIVVGAILYANWLPSGIPGFDVASLMQLAGSIIGVSGAVFAAIAVEDWKRKTAIVEDRRLVFEALFEFHCVYKKIPKDVPEKSIWNSRNAQIAAIPEAVSSLKTAYEMYRSTVKQVRIRDKYLMTHLIRFEGTFDAAIPQIDEAVEALPRPVPPQAALELFYVFVSGLDRDIRRHLDAALRVFE